LYLCLSS